MCRQCFTWDYAALLVGIYTYVLLDVLGFAGGLNFKIGLAVEPHEVAVLLLGWFNFSLFHGGVTFYVRYVRECGGSAKSGTGIIQYNNSPNRTLIEHRQAFIQYPGLHQV